MTTTEPTATIWGLKIPAELRALLVAAFPGWRVLFPSVMQPDGCITDFLPEGLITRIVQQGGPAQVICWPDIQPTEGGAARLAAAGIVVGQVAPARLCGPGSGVGNRPGPYGLRFVDMTVAPTDMAANSADASQLLSDYRRLGLSAVTETGLQRALPSEIEGLGLASAVFVVADDHAQVVPESSAQRLADLHTLLARASQENPGRTLVFLTNGQLVPNALDPEQASILHEIRTLADVICSAFWTPKFLDRVLALYTQQASAALDACLVGKRVVVTESSLLQALARGEVDEATAFGQHYFGASLFCDPIHGTALPSDRVMAVIARRRDLLPSARLPQAQIWPEAYPRSVVEPIGDALHLASASYTLIDPERLLSVPNDLIAPGWLLGDLPEPGAPVICLAQERAIIPVAAIAALEGKLATIRLHPAEDDPALDDLALYQPDICLQALISKIRASGARKALIIDLDRPMTRLFARACALEGVERLFLPPTITASAVYASLTSLCDTMLAWHPQQVEAALAAGMEMPAIITTRLPASPPAPDGGRTIIWLDKTGFRSAVLQNLIKSAMICAELSGQPLRFALGPDSISKLDERLFESIVLNPMVDYVLIQFQDRNPVDILSESAFIVTNDRKALFIADQIGRPSHNLVLPDNIKMEGVRSNISDVLWKHYDHYETFLPHYEEKGHAGIFSNSIEGVLSDWLNSAPDSLIKRVKPGRIPVAVSTIPLNTWKKETLYLAAMLGVNKHFEIIRSSRLSEMVDADMYLQWGLRPSSRKTLTIEKLQRLKLPFLNVEDGFIRSIGIGLSGEPGLSVYFDDLGTFYDATRPSRLELDINENNLLSEAESRRARALIDHIVARKITKYNFAPYRNIERPDPSRSVILVVDQRGGDVSIEKGLASEATFATMVERALTFSETHDILIKTHPDANIGGRESAIGAEVLQRVASHPAVTLVTADMNPYSLIDIADKVFVVSSGMGFEALLAGREVWCFGAPFYAGWGLTQDQVDIPRRTARPSLEQVFHQFYINHSRYYDPIAGARGEIEAVISYIDQQRPWSLEQCQARPWLLSPLPAAHVEAKGITAASGLADYDTLWLYRFSNWKQSLYQRLFPEKDVRYPESNRNFAEVLASKRPAILVWGYLEVPGLLAFANRHGIPVFRIEDGFLRSVGLGANHVLPYSACVDSLALYYNSRSPSDLETLLQNHDFSVDPKLLERARAARLKIVETGLSKYNFPMLPNPDPYGPKNRKRVLVIGQVEDDASIKYGAFEPITNNELVRLARAENPDAQVIYKIHPDVLAARRPELSDPAEVAEICEIYSDPLALSDAFSGVDHVYTITSLAGFEAMMREIPVTAVGMPFYAGWGLTDDRSQCARRTRKLSLDELFAGAYLLYPHYFDPETGNQLTIDEVIDRLLRELYDLEIERLSAL